MTEKEIEKTIEKSNNIKTQFYERALNEAEKLEFEMASGVDGIDDEITILRIKIKSLLHGYTGKEEDDVRLMLDATETLAKLVKTRYSITKAQKNSLKNAINNVLKDIVVPLGVAWIEKK